jgi:hypothetical protein
MIIRIPSGITRPDPSGWNPLIIAYYPDRENPAKENGR